MDDAKVQARECGRLSWLPPSFTKPAPPAARCVRPPCPWLALGFAGFAIVGFGIGILTIFIEHIASLVASWHCAYDNSKDSCHLLQWAVLHPHRYFCLTDTWQGSFNFLQPPISMAAASTLPAALHPYFSIHPFQWSFLFELCLGAVAAGGRRWCLSWSSANYY